MRFLLALFTIYATLAPGLASAADGVASSATSAAPVKRFSLFSEVSVSSSLQPWSSVDHDDTMDLVLVPSFAISPHLTLLGKFIAEQDLRGEQLNKVAKSNIALSHSGIDLNRSLHLSGAIGAILPVDRQKRLNDSLLMGFTAGPTLTLDFARLRVPGLKVSYGVSGARFFHDYNVKADGKPNVQYSMANFIGIAYSFNDHWSASSSSSLNTGWTYSGKTVSDFDFLEELDFQINPAWGLAIGVDNSGDTLRADGINSNISVFNNNSASVYGGLTYSF